MRKFFLAAAVLGGFAAATPASALPVLNPLGTEAGQSRAESVALYCDRKGRCIRVKRPGYYYRGPVVRRSCGPGWRWNGYRCVSRGKAVIRAPGVKIKIRP